MKKKYDLIDQTPWNKVLYDHISIYFVSSDFLKTFEDMKFLLNVLLGPHCVRQQQSESQEKLQWLDLRH